MEWNETADKHGNVTINPAGSKDRLGTIVSIDGEAPLGINHLVFVL
jgi:hypothetical protein